ncbi:HERC1 [Symbiodinium necroappetens]|uniref:HERC1 protein n=1 Tax=Symbiodinium necroappetens TaxID=1628268 RepID=A0A812UP55_9DINO|nr:HERC1 [Symbiodinium necroappetens]
MHQPLLADSSAPSPPANSEASGTSWTFVNDPQIPKLLEMIEGFVKGGFRDTRVLEDKPDFTQKVLETPFQLILTHSCLVLGPAGAGKTTLVQALGGECFQPAVQPGPHLRNRTEKAQSIGVDLEDLSDKLRLEIIDTPGWCPEKSTDIHAQYKEVLREKGLPKEHAPHIILLCVPVSMLRQFDEDKAKQMSEQLHKLKFDRRFTIKVLPVATKADTESRDALPDLQAAIKKLAEAAFESSGAFVDQAEWTMFDPNDASRVRGPNQVMSWIRKALLQQLRSAEFTGLWRLALAKSVKDHTRQHCETLPANDSALRLFNSACRTVAAAYGRDPDLEACKSVTLLPEELPWWALLEIPDSEAKTWQLPYDAAFWLGLRKRVGPWSIAALLFVFSLVLLIAPLMSMDQMMGKYNNSNDQLDRMTECQWTDKTGQCTGLVYIGAPNKTECSDVCCRMGKDYCSTWQYRDSDGCWLGHPSDDCSGDDGWYGGQLSQP